MDMWSSRESSQHWDSACSQAVVFRSQLASQGKHLAGKARLDAQPAGSRLISIKTTAGHNVLAKSGQKLSKA